MQICLFSSGIAFGIGIILLATAQDLAMVIIGRVLMGVGVGFANSSSTLCKPLPLYMEQEIPSCIAGKLCGILLQPAFICA